MVRVFATCAGLWLTASLTAQAQTPPPSPPTIAATPAGVQTTAPTAGAPGRKAAAAKGHTGQLAWHRLTPAQQEALRPLAGKWPELGEERRRKWLEVSKNYHALPAAEQTKMHERMTEWVSLSQQQRTQARQNYVETQKLAPNEKAAKWQAYQELTPEEKRKLAAKAAVRPTGAAVVKPAASAEKLTKVPVTRLTPKPGNAPSKPAPVRANTLLPQPAAQPSPGPTRQQQ